MGFIEHILAVLFGARCEAGCGHRVYPKDREWHRDEECWEVPA